MLIKKGDTGELVKQIQNKLYLNSDGVFGDETEKAVILFQKSKKLFVDGEVGRQTWEALGLDTDQSNQYKVPDFDNVLNYKGKYITKDNLTIDKAYLDDDEYVTDYGKVGLKGFFLHHTAGWDNPYQTINSWNIDDRGRIATQYCIGGSNIYGNSKYDGDVVECFPDGYLGWHLGGVGNKNS
jgi:peptidoglycan hydrolase-like protein with peptidoglycan-binding domain